MVTDEHADDAAKEIAKLIGDLGWAKRQTIAEIIQRAIDGAAETRKDDGGDTYEDGYADACQEIADQALMQLNSRRRKAKSTQPLAAGAKP